MELGAAEAGGQTEELGLGLHVVPAGGLEVEPAELGEPIVDEKGQNVSVHIVAPRAPVCPRRSYSSPCSVISMRRPQPS